MAHTYYSQRLGSNPNPDGLPLEDVLEMFEKVFSQLEDEGYFSEAFGFYCTDDPHVEGTVKDVDLEILISVRKKYLWPIREMSVRYDEDDFLDMVEFLYQYVSKPIDGTMHSHNGCGMHWKTFNKSEGEEYYLSKINKVLDLYKKKFELSKNGEVLLKPEVGFEKMFDADVPSTDKNVVDRIDSAVVKFRRHGASLDDRRQAVRDLAGVLEYLRDDVKKLLTTKDENDLFNIANNFGIRHHNEKQKTNYDTAIWLSWMFYFFLSTLHVVLRKSEHDKSRRKN